MSVPVTNLRWPLPVVAWSRALVSGQRLKSGHGCLQPSTKSQPLDHQEPAASEKALAFQLRKNELPLKRQKVAKPVKCLLEGKSTVCVNRHMGGLKERVVLSR